ncbi:MAG: FGGY-family carbohydrate kinase [Clostridiales Family XIII bacterium]|jgi:xylulokinase|nr:FGGY-family carbohydrate kinase [Clostridiales Family XIII bacterium]
MEERLIIAYDMGTTGNKACLYSLRAGGIEKVAEKQVRYGVSIRPGGGVEQNPEELWGSIRGVSKALLSETGTRPEDIAMVSFCTQMQAVVLLDKNGKPLRPIMNYMDERAAGQFEKFNEGPIRVDGLNAVKNLAAIRENGITAASAKDPVYKYKWVRENEPEIFSKIYKYVDVGGWVLHRCTGRYVTTEDVAYTALVYDARGHHWSEKLCRMHQVEMSHLPEIVGSTECVGTLTEAAAADMGLTTNCKVIGGGGDVAMIALGAGCTKLGDTLAYIGTSGWVTTCVDKLGIDLANSIGSTVGAQQGVYLYFAEMELAGKNIEWARDNLMLDGEGVYAAKELSDEDVMHRIGEIAGRSSPGAGGVIFMPYLLGNRCPFEDVFSRASFYNISLTNTKADLMRSVIESIAYHMYWMIELIEKKKPMNNTLRIIGGGAKSDLLCQILADMSGRTTERTREPQNAGVLGAGILAANHFGYLDSLEDAKRLAQVGDVFVPDPETRGHYMKNYQIYKQWPAQNKKNFRFLNK